MNWKLRLVLISIIAYCLSFCLTAGVCSIIIVNRIGRIADEPLVYSAETFDVDTNREDTIQEEEIVFVTSNRIQPSEDVINVLLVGKDIKEGSLENGRTDSMILLSMNRNTKKVSMVSFMRDCYVQIPGYSNNKLNAAYSIGGYDLLDRTIEQNFGIKIDYNVGVNFTSFTKLIDKLGGIDIELSQEEADYILKKTKKTSGLSEGMNHLSGKQALWYARTRYVSTATESNDFGRTSRQRIVLQTVFSKVAGLPLNELTSMAYEMAGEVETDMSVTDMIMLGTEVYNMKPEGVASYRIPNGSECTDEVINKMMVLVVDFDKAQQNLAKWLYDAQ